MFIFLYPKSYLKENVVEESFSNEFKKLKSLNKSVHIFDIEELNSTDFSFCKDKTVIYRGWTLKELEYENLEAKIVESGGEIITSLQNYKDGLYMKNWISKIEDLTPKSYFFKNHIAAFEYVDHHDNHSYFVKDFVASLRGVSSNIVSHREDLEQWVADAEFFNGKLEGGICLREVENFKVETEVRYFVLNDVIYSNDNKEIPEIVRTVINNIKLPFFCIDIVLNDKDEWRVVEIGDGQVSSSLTWDVNNFTKVFEKL